MRARIPLVIVALVLGGGLAVLGTVAGWPVAAVIVAALLGVALGALLGQVFAWTRATAGRLARLENSVNHRLEGLKTGAERRHEATMQLSRQSRDAISRLNRTDELKGLEKKVDALSRRQLDEHRETRHHFVQRLDDQVALLEAFVQLQRLVPVPLPMPRPGTWAASEDLLLWLAGYVLERRPSLVVDLGSGQSSVWMAAAMRTAGYTGRVVGVDHDAEYAEATRALGRRQGLSDWLTVVHAPLIEQDIDGRRVTWYDRDALTDLRDIDLLSIDGPPGQGNAQARWPALPVFRDRLSTGASVILDDMIRIDEQVISDEWMLRYPELVPTRLDYEKGALVLSVPD